MPAVLLAWTLGRLCLVPIVIAAFIISPFLCALTLAAFVAADLYDGVVARELEADDPTRRALDSIVDRVSVWAVYLAVCVTGYLPAELLGLLFARDLYCAIWCYRMMRAQGVAIKADWLHRSLNLALAGWVAVASLLSEPPRSALFIVILVFAAFVAVDLRRCVGKVLGAPDLFRDMVVPARRLRAR
jgi:phosphatidylglycerophosphate synthase